MPIKLFLAALALLSAALPMYAQIPSIAVPVGTPLPLKVRTKLQMKAGEPVRAELLYPVYVGSQLALPVGTIVTGYVVSISPDRTRRFHARLHFDFTPFHIPVVSFDHIQLADGTTLPLMTSTATDGAPIYRLVPPPPHKGGFFAQQFSALKTSLVDEVRVFTAPGKGDRFTQFIWSQLPLHPERISRDTAWTVETSAPLELPVSAKATPALLLSSGTLGESSEPKGKGSAVPDATTTPAAESDSPPTWILQAHLDQPMSSATAKTGQQIHATVAEPIRNADGTVAVPTGSIISGSITAARPSRSFGRAGTLRFRFTELRLPGEDAVAVQTALTGADSAASGNMTINSEGEVKPKPQDKLAVPLLFLALAARPLDRDGGSNHNMLGKDAVASNALGLIGFIVGTAARQPNFAAGIGYYGAAVSIYERIFRRGKEVSFARDTRIMLETTARRSAAIKPNLRPAP